MPRTTEPQRGPSLDDILARLAELAPAPDDSTSAPVPETGAARRAPILDLDHIAEATEALVPAGASTIETGDDQPVIDLRDRAEIDVKAVVAGAIVESVVAAEGGPGTAGAVADVAAPEAAEIEVIEPDIAIESEPEIEVIEPDIAIESEPEIEVIEPESASDDASSRPPSAAVGLPPVAPVDISRADPVQPSAGAHRRPAPVRSTARPHNPFKRLILWSLMLGLGLLVGALVLLVT